MRREELCSVRAETPEAGTSGGSLGWGKRGTTVGLGIYFCPRHPYPLVGNNCSRKGGPVTEVWERLPRPPEKGARLCRQGEGTADTPPFTLQG